MAEALLTFALEEMLKKVGSIAYDGISRAWGLERDLELLSESTRRIQDVLQDAEEKQAQDAHIKPWLLKLQGLVYAAEDVLDEFSYETLRRRVEIQNQPKRKVRDFVSRNNPILFRLNMCLKVKKINESLAEIEKQALSELALRSKAGADRRKDGPSTLLNRETDSILDKTEKQIGRASDVEKIIKMLEVSSSDPPLLIR